MSEKNITVLNDVDQTLSLDFSKKAFADLIINFLGAKERLTFHSEKPFLIRINDIKQFDLVLKEKINREKGVILDSFIATVHYDDSTSRSVTSLSSVDEYLELRDVIATGVTLEWHIITRLDSNKGTETQKVEVTFNDPKKPCKGDVLLSIEHTNQAWGNEVLNLFKDKISEVSIEVPRVAKLASSIIERMTFANYIGIIAMLSVLLTTSWLAVREPSVPDPSLATYSMNDLIIGYFEKNQDIEYQKGIYLMHNLHYSQLESASKDFIVDTEVREIIIKYSEEKYKELERNGSITFEELLKVLLYVFISPLFALYLIPRAYLRNIINHRGISSFVILNIKTEKSYNNYISEKSLAKYYTISTCFYAVMTSVIGSYVYALFLS